MKPIVFIIKLILVILMLAFIWGNSFLPGELSVQESEKVLELVEPVVEPVTEMLTTAGYDVDEHFVVRKMAHFTEYTVLGALMFLLFVKPDGRSRYLLPAGLCLAAAGVDEGIQILALDRGPALRDVLLDFCGSCIGILCAAFVILLIYYKVRNRREWKALYGPQKNGGTTEQKNSDNGRNKSRS